MRERFSTTARALPFPQAIHTDRRESRRVWWISVALIVVLGWLLFGWHVAQRGLWSSHEGRAAQNAQDIVDNGNWLVPHLFTGEPELQKPPLYYWSVAALGLMNGGAVTELCVRLPAALAGCAGLVIVFWFGRRMWDWETGIWAVAILATTTRFAWLARVGRIDMPLCLVTMSALALFWRDFARYRDEPEANNRFITGYSIYVLIAAGVLLKGPVAVVLILLPIISFLGMAGFPIIPKLQAGWKTTWNDLRLVRGLGLIALLTVPWYLYASIATNGEFFWSFFFHHNIERALGSDEALKSGPVWFYIPRLFVDTFPWSILLPGIWLWLTSRPSLWWPRRQVDPAQPTTNYNYMFLLSWGVSQFVFLSLVSFKRADYLLPAMPPVALLLAGWLRERDWRPANLRIHRLLPNPRSYNRVVMMTAGLLAAMCVPLLIWAGIEFHRSGIVNSLLKIGILADHLNETDRFMMTHVERLVRENWTLLAVGGFVVVVGVWLVHTGWHQCRHRRLVMGLALPWLVGFLFQVHVLLPALDPLREMSRFATAVRALAGPEERIYYFGKFDADLAFHIGRPAQALEDWEEMVSLGDNRSPQFVIIKASQWEWVQRDPRLAHWAALIDNRLLAFGGHRDHRLLITNRPVLARSFDEGVSRR